MCAEWRIRMCRLRTASLPHPALRLDSLRAQRGNPVNKVAPFGARFIYTGLLRHFISRNDRVSRELVFVSPVNYVLIFLSFLLWAPQKRKILWAGKGRNRD